MTMESLPGTMYQIVSGVDMGDLEYIEGKVLAGDYFQVSGNINTLGNTLDFIVPAGKTAFLISAKIMNPTHPSPAPVPSLSTTQQKSLVTAALQIDGVIKDKAVIGEATMAGNKNNQHGGGAGNGYGNLGNGRFDVLGLSLAGDGAKKIEIENILENGPAFATMSGYLV